MSTSKGKPTVLLVSRQSDTIEKARELVPSSFNLEIAALGMPEYDAALPTANYLVGFIASSLTDELYEKAGQLKFVQLLSAGYDTLDVAAATRAGIRVANNGGGNANATAEHAILLTLATSRHLVWQHNTVVSGKWQGTNAPRRHELRGRTLGIVGFGTIGRKVASVAQALGMSVLYYDIARLREHEEAALGVSFRLLDELLRSSDVVSLHVPLNDATKGLIGRHELDQMRSSALLINTSRGAVVDETALVGALSTGVIGGAGLDVFEQEPPPKDHPFFKLDNVVLTPHLAGPTWESRTAVMRNAFDNIERFERGQAPLWVIPELRGLGSQPLTSY